MNSSKLTQDTVEAETSDSIEVAALRRRVDKLLEERKHSAKWLYTAVGMSKAGWFQMWNSGSIKATVLFSIARAFNMDVGTLVDPILKPELLSEPAPTYQPRRRFIEERLVALRAVGLDLLKLYVGKTHAVPKHQAEQLAVRCGQLLQQLRTYGIDLDTASSIRPPR